MIGGEQNQNSVIPIYFVYFWTLISKIIVVFAENQYFGRFWGVMTYYQTLSIQSADYIIFDKMPVVSDNMPVKSDNMPVESDNMPVDSNNMPILVVAKQVSTFLMSLITRMFWFVTLLA